jgi:malate synthase
LLADERAALVAKDPGRADRRPFREACSLFERLSTATTFEEFLTLPAYELLLAMESD